MTRDQIIAWAKQSGAVLELSTTPAKDFAFLSRFASLVAAHEREECAKVCEEWATGHAADTGECAYEDCDFMAAAIDCAGLIRARKEKT